MKREHPVSPLFELTFRWRNKLKKGTKRRKSELSKMSHIREQLSTRESGDIRPSKQFLQKKNIYIDNNRTVEETFEMIVVSAFLGCLFFSYPTLPLPKKFFPPSKIHRQWADSVSESKGPKSGKGQFGLYLPIRTGLRGGEGLNTWRGSQARFGFLPRRKHDGTRLPWKDGLRAQIITPRATNCARCKRRNSSLFCNIYIGRWNPFGFF